MIFNIPITIDDPEEIDWAYFWEKKLEAKEDREKDWDKAAPNFGKSAIRDNYDKELISKLILDSEDTLLDLGCGEGSISLQLYDKVKSITAIDSSSKMIELYDKKIKKEEIKNIKTIKADITDINIDNIGHHDIILASRSLNGILNIQETIANINEIANKYVFITVFGPNNWKVEKDFYESIDKEYSEFPSHRYLFNILVDMGIYPNIENLDIGKHREYKDIDEILERGKWRLFSLNDDEKEELKNYINETYTINPDTGNLYNKYDKADWVLFWWKVEE
ncbi:MAG: class I SAM-dependent methyltransferase [archaeon]|nr:class I SAM-dependent methyltransferase [archaeon]